MTSRLPTRIDATGNTLADSGVIVYNEDGTVNRSSFGRHLSRLEWQLCDALDKVNRKRTDEAHLLRKQRRQSRTGHG